MISSLHTHAREEVAAETRWRGSHVGVAAGAAGSNWPLTIGLLPRNGEIAQALFLTENQIDTHLRSIFRKLEIRSRSQLARAL